MHTLDYENYKHGGVNITGVRMVDPTRRDTVDTVSKWISWEMNSGKNPGNLTEKTLTVKHKICSCLSVNRNYFFFSRNAVGSSIDV